MPGLMPMDDEEAPKGGPPQPPRKGSQPMADDRMSREEDTEEPEDRAEPEDDDEAMASDGPAPNVAPEEQAQYESFVKNGMKLIYSENSMPKVLENLKSGGDPMTGLANTAVMIVMTTEQSAEAKGVQLSDDVVFQGGRELFEDLANLAKEAGIHDFTDDEMKTAWLRAIDMYRDAKESGGQLDKEGALADLEEIKAADAGGNLDSVLPGASEFAKGAAPPTEGEGEPEPPVRGLAGGRV